MQVSIDGRSGMVTDSLCNQMWHSRQAGWELQSTLLGRELQRRRMLLELTQWRSWKGSYSL